MEIEGTTFGAITIDGKTYEHDVIIRLSGEVVKRKKKLSRSTTAPHTCSLKTKRSSSSRADASSSFSARARWAMCISRRKPRLISQRRLQGSVAAHPRGDWCVQQVAYKEDRAFSRDLLKRTPRQRWSDKRFSRAGVTSFGR